jgi:molecular chaperone GrpE (heat shock protein)
MPLRRSEEYRERAKRAREMAVRTQSERSKASFLRVAADCDRLAELAAKLEQEPDPEPD